MIPITVPPHALEAGADALAQGLDVLARDRAALDVVDELVDAVLGLAHLEAHVRHGELTATTGLADVARLDLAGLGEHLLVGDLGAAGGHLAVVLLDDAADHHLEVQLAHAGDDEVAGLLDVVATLVVRDGALRLDGPHAEGIDGGRLLVELARTLRVELGQALDALRQQGLRDRGVRLTELGVDPQGALEVLRRLLVALLGDGDAPETEEGVCEPGTYLMTMQSNDGIRVFLGGQMVFEDPDVHRDRFTENTTVEIAEAGYYPLYIVYFERKGTSTLEMYWQPPGAESFDFVPADAFFHDNTAKRPVAPMR